MKNKFVRDEDGDIIDPDWAKFLVELEQMKKDGKFKEPKQDTFTQYVIWTE